MRMRMPAVVAGLVMVATVQALPAVAAPEAEDLTSVFVPVTPVRVLDAQAGPGQSVTADLLAQLPTDVTSVVMNITGTGQTAATSITVFQTNNVRGEAINLSLRPGEPRSSLTTTNVNADRRVDLYNAAGSVRLTADLTGYYARTGGWKFKSLGPARAGDARIGANTTRTVDLSAKVPAGAKAVAVNLTGANATAPTSVTAWQSGSARPQVPNIRLNAGATVPNLAVLAVGADRKIDLHNAAGDITAIVDVVGYYGADADLFFVPHIRPYHHLDTRTGEGTFDSPGPVEPNGGTRFQVWTTAQVELAGVVFSLTGITNRVGTDVSAPFGTTNLHLAPRQVATNLVMAPTIRDVGISNRDGQVHLIGDISGYFTRTCAGSGVSCVFSWGINANGMLGDGSDVYLRETPKSVPALTGATAIAGGVLENFAVRADGTVVAWGGSEAVPGGRSRVPVQVHGLSGITTVAAGNRNGYALKSDGTVWAWGEARWGQTGDGIEHGNDDFLTTPAQVTGLTNVVDIAAGWLTAYAVQSDGTVWAWGVNTFGELGNGVACPDKNPVTCHTNVPVQVSGLTGVAEVSEDGFARKADGTVWTWGSPHLGLLGIGPATQPALTPVQVTTLSNVAEIDGSNQNRYALKSDGTVWSWGGNTDGQIGNGTTGAPVTTPVQVSSLTNVRSIASGEALNGYAVTSDGSMWSWGNNLNGQLGDGTSENDSAVPVKVLNLTGVAKVSGYYFGALAVVPQPR